MGTRSLGFLLREHNVTNLLMRPAFNEAGFFLLKTEILPASPRLEPEVNAEELLATALVKRLVESLLQSSQTLRHSLLNN